MAKLWISGVSLTLLLILVGCKQDRDDSMKSMQSHDSMQSMGAKPANDKTMANSPTAPTTPMKMYTCTMHPEVVSSTPGKCPKCEMDLVEKK